MVLIRSGAGAGRIGRALLAAAVVLLTRGVAAQQIVTPTPDQKAHCALASTPQGEALCLKGYSTAPLALSPEVVEGGSAYRPMTRIYKPAGSGPFPAIVMMHTCAAVQRNSQLEMWVGQAVTRGYVAFVLDSYGDRGVADGCGSAWDGAMQARVRDAYDAASYLAGLDFVDARRIAAMGWSHGGRVAYITSGPAAAGAFATKARIAAVVSVYGRCASTRFKRDFVPAAPAVPILALLGWLDADGDPQQCQPLLERAKASGATVEWHVFPHAGHVWDEPERRGNQIPLDDPPYKTLAQYDPAVTRESVDLAFDFLGRVMK